MFGYLRYQKSRFTERRKRRKLEEKRDRVYAAYEKDILNAKNEDERGSLESSQRFECSEYEDEIARMDSLELIAKGAQFHLDISDLPLPPNESSHWVQGQYDTQYIHSKSLREFCKAGRGRGI
jgi:hypothetical protein